MEKRIKCFIWIAVFGAVIGIIIAMNLPKPNFTIYDEEDLKSQISEVNSQLPFLIGTMGTIDSITYQSKTITFNYTSLGTNYKKHIFKNKYNEFKAYFKFCILILNGQNNKGSAFTSFLDKKELNWKNCVHTIDGDFTTWEFSSKELKDFSDFCLKSPTEALKPAIDAELEIVNNCLPITLDDVNNPVRFVTINALFGKIDKDFLPQVITHVGNDVIIKYDVDDNIYDLSDFEMINDNEGALDAVVSWYTEDVNCRFFVGLLVISHSNLVFNLVGRETQRSVSVRLPYYILNKHINFYSQIFK